MVVRRYVVAVGRYIAAYVHTEEHIEMTLMTRDEVELADYSDQRYQYEQ